MANITRYDPFEDLFKEFGKGFWVKPYAFPAETGLEMKIDVKEDDKAFTVKADIPGVKKEDIHVEVDGNRVSISAEVKSEKEQRKGETVIHTERYEGKVFRSFALAGNVDESAVEASYKDGLLQLKLPKLAGGKSRRISIQ